MFARNALALSLVLALAAAVSADPIADGRVGTGEYSNWFDVQFSFEGGGPKYEGGRFGLRQSGGSLFAVLVLDRNLVDNSYGDLASIGWGAAAPSGKHHNFKDLLGSDDASFTFRDAAGNAVTQFRLDYLAENASSLSGYSAALLEPKTAKGGAKSLKDASKKLDKAHKDYAKKTRDAAKKAAEAASKPDDEKKQRAAAKAAKKAADAKRKLDKAQAVYDAALSSSGSGGGSSGAPNVGVLSFGSSLAWNFDTYGALLENSPLPPTLGGKNVYGSPAGAPDWIWDVIYEVELDAGLFAGGVGMPTVDLVHASPNKLGGNKVFIELPPTDLTPTPEPGTIVLIGLGIAAAAVYRRRRGY